MRAAPRPLPSSLLLAGLLLGAATPVRSTETPDEPRPIEAESLRGEPLRRPELPVEFRQRQEALLAAARAGLDAEPDDPEAAIWVGRRLAYLGRYREAIAVYTEALERHPQNAALYRHRGHRYITTRRLEAAIDDLSRAAELTRGEPDEVEPDGLPNELGIPTSTLQGNIYYHLGLAHYLRGDFEAALAAYREALAASTTADMRVATSYWLYLTLRRMGRKLEALEAIDPIHLDMEIIENHDYHRLVMVYRGKFDPEALRAELGDRDDSLQTATMGYGLGAWYLIEGDRRRARELFTRVLTGDQWAAFGYIAAEAEMARGDA
ncbi:MAG: tetratricopeptide repeat protein [Thermoanaerobaculia bacterium]|nr:tetratricopeptide repeat protein [Thermoanaerobaculia bacterium]